MSVQICSDATWPMFGTTGGEKKSACPWFDFTHLWFPMRGVSCFTPRGNVSVSMTDATKQDSKISRFPIPSMLLQNTDGFLGRKIWSIHL